MVGSPVRVLLIEDDEDDYLLTRDLFAALPGRPFDLEWVSTYEAALEAIGRNQHAVYLLDYRLGQRSGLDLLRAARDLGCKAPLILLTGVGDQEVDVASMKAGAADYLIKGRLDAALLERSLRYALERQRAQEALRKAHEELETRVAERTAELSRANTQLAEADQRKDLFLAMLAHELRNPLAPILNALHLMGHGGADPAQSERARAMVERQVRHLARLVDDLLDVSRITRGKIVLRKERAALATLVAHAVETARPYIDSRGHQLEITLPEEPIHLEVDPARIEQVLVNLLHNAAKYSASGQRIWLTAAREAGDVVLRVRDIGRGIPTELVSRIFDLFVQADQSLDRSQGGLGIGLTLVRSLVDLHGGSVQDVSAGLGKGSAFDVRLPALPLPPVEDRPPMKSDAKPPPTAANPRRVLVVDDNVDAAESLAAFLQLEGFETRVAHDGPAALAAATAYQPEVVLLDIGLPGMNGYAVARQLRAQSGLNKALLVAITGYGEREDQRRSHEAGFDHHLVKPVDPEILEKLLICSSAGTQA